MSGGERPLAGRRVAIIHPAWHSCGTYRVIVSQFAAYRALGATTLSVAVMDAPSPSPASEIWRPYMEAASDLPADARYFCAPSRESMLARWYRARCDEASYLVEMAKLTEPPHGLEQEQIDLIHANHFFTLPLVARLRGARDIPLLLETHDIQARQFALRREHVRRNRKSFSLPYHASYDDMLAVELAWMRKADLCIHLNAEESADFERLLPDTAHRLVYPAITPVSCGPGGNRVLFVASNNYPNYLSLRWLLEAVLPHVPGVAVEIYGNIDEAVKSSDAALYSAGRRYFKGRVEDLNAAYAQAAAVLLPTIEGHGLSIKTVEAMSSGAPLIATQRAFRGMGFDPAALRNVTLADDASSFAAALRAIGTRPETGPRADSDTRRLYDEQFSFDAYARTLEEAAAPLLRA
jgi:glycosyltransferase involved in cell wall biosynthesis